MTAGLVIGAVIAIIAAVLVPLPFIRERRLWGDTGNGDFEAQLLAPSDMVAAS